jgi:hypothetical protein
MSPPTGSLVSDANVIIALPSTMALISSHLVREPCTHAPRPARALTGRAAVCSSGAPLRLRRSLPCSARPLGSRRDVRVLAADTGASLARWCVCVLRPALLGAGLTAVLSLPSSPLPEDADAELEKRLAAFKGTRDWKDVRSEREGKAKGGESGEKAAPSSAPLDEASWAGETVFFEGPPSRGDLAVNVLLGVTLLWLARPGAGPVGRPPGLVAGPLPPTHPPTHPLRTPSQRSPCPWQQWGRRCGCTTRSRTSGWR